MNDASVSDPYVVSLLVTHENGSVSGLAADVAYDVAVDGMEVVAKQQVNVWTGLGQSQKTKFQTFVDNIVGSL